MQTRNTVKVGNAFTKVRMLVAQGSDQRNRGLTGQNMRLSHHFGPQGEERWYTYPTVRDAVSTLTKAWPH